jgi:hypothetical protein
MKTIYIPLNEEASQLALGPYVEGASLLPESRAAIEAAPKSPLGVAVRDVSYTVEQARDMLDYYRSGHLVGRDDPLELLVQRLDLFIDGIEEF